MSASEIKSYFEFILPLVRASGELLLEAKEVKVETKGEPWDLVTMYDRKIEEVLIDKIREEYPKHKFIGEEDSAAKNRIAELTDDPTWIIDPIDGTANFVRGLPITCISVGFAVKKQVVMGVVFNPYMDELYYSIKGEGAYLNGTRLQTSGLEDIDGACFNYELSLARREALRDLYIYRLKHLIGVTQGIRSLGCAVLGLCYVAAGIIDAYQCDGLYPWDVAAGSLIVTEAGGHVCDTTGKKELDIMNPNFLATATKPLSDKFMEIERVADAERLAKTKK
ncbi:inositol monophosphatase 1-like [Aethina tumida]|uniref:inositol monophosphatase 1-like n=1 Tax=Aethina tumida TaxID=116153 RepID=UPI002148A465|nr:inositol monophosphatase 1-like [Aethina tumida]